MEPMNLASDPAAATHIKVVEEASPREDARLKAANWDMVGFWTGGQIGHRPGSDGEHRVCRAGEG
jgi:hypothetical protein